MDITFKLTDKDYSEIARHIILQQKQLAALGEPKNDIVTYTIKEAALVTKQSENTIRNHINNGLLKSSRTGKKHIILEQNLKTYLQTS